MYGQEVPPFFICPISLQIMTDPVTVITGITYDRHSIHRWISLYGHSTCPVTNQPLSDPSLTPNSTLHRLIHSWTSQYLSLPPPQSPPIDIGQLVKCIKELTKEAKLPPPPSTKPSKSSLMKIKNLIQEDDLNRSHFEQAGLVPLLASLASSSSQLRNDVIDVLCVLKPSKESLKKSCERDNGGLIAALSNTVSSHHCNHRVKIESTHLLKSVFEAVGDAQKMDLPLGLFEGLVEMLKDQNSDRLTTMSALSNRVRAVQAGTVAVLVESVVECGTGDRRRCEVMVAVLERVCSRAEGRRALGGHPMGIAAVAGKLMKVSRVVDDRATRVLLGLCRFCCWGGVGGVEEEMVVVGAVERLCLLVQVECGGKARERAKEMLGLHGRTWSRSPCFPFHSVGLP
ncbi:E3 ubiquitin-protein ligase PUB23 [Acorus calamus]|uniref:U-box domain-containing protein n=1 Tax=Acorus calamus TaxID=4465 RepID=A0AAV9FIN7_ACOCL|nr:E3 ubiquitin-protein ligase PUB23 [Acorus calamus]